MRRTIAFATVALVVAVGGACIWAVSARAPKKPTTVAQRGERNSPVLALTGLTFTDSCEASSSVLAVDALEVRDRTLGPFSMRGVEEVEMRGVRGRFAACASRASAADATAAASPRFDELLTWPVRDLSLGFVSRVSAKPADLVFQDGGADRLRVRAGRIDVGLGSGGLRLDDGVAIEAANGGALRAGRATWQVKDGTLRVAGAYEWTDATGARQAGRNGRFAIDPAGTLRPER